LEDIECSVNEEIQFSLVVKRGSVGISVLEVQTKFLTDTRIKRTTIDDCMTGSIQLKQLAADLA
jgi:hypothetical protein